LWVELMVDTPENPRICRLCHGLLQFAYFAPSKRAYSLHCAFFDWSNPSTVRTYANDQAASVGAWLFISFQRISRRRRMSARLH
jgi:hypothetical protein